MTTPITASVTLERDRDTKNTVRYNEVVDDGETPVVRNLYIAKEVAATLGNPTSITVTITA